MQASPYKQNNNNLRVSYKIKRRRRGGYNELMLIDAQPALALLLAWLAAVASPGPDLFQLIRVGTKDRRAGVLCALGIMVGNTFWITASLLGLSALVQAAPRVLSALQIVGGAYLLYMGIGAMKAGLRAKTTAIGVAETVRNPFRLGILTNLSNPKAILFFGAIFAQFLEPGAGVGTALLLISTGLVWFVGFALAVDKLKGPVQRYGYVVDAVAGAIFTAIAVWMIWEGLASAL